MKYLLLLLIIFSFIEIGSSQTIQYFFDDQNRLIKATLDNGTLIQYDYDELGNRITQTINTSGTTPMSGQIFTEENEPVSIVQVLNEDSIQEITEEDGAYQLDLSINENYTITPQKNIYPSNGVSTFDIILILKHILHIDPLDSPYKIIAADVDKSGHVSTLDIVDIQQVILNQDAIFEDSTSWRFVNADYVFPDALDPFASPFPEVFTVENLLQPQQADFIGIKLGDVNNTVQPNQFWQGTDDRTLEDDLTFVLPDIKLKTGEEYAIAFRSKDFEKITGYQYTLGFDQTVLEFIGLENGALPNLTVQNFGWKLLDEGIITTSWNKLEGLSLDEGSILFTLNFKVKKHSSLKDLIQINSDYTKAEAYNTNVSNPFLEVDLVFEQTEPETSKLTQFQLFQNKPNPFEESTTIGFNLPNATDGTLTIYDLSGNAVKIITNDFNAGYNEIQVSKAEFSQFGVLLYRLDVDGYSAIRKMVLLH